MKTNATYLCPYCGERHEYDPENPARCAANAPPVLDLRTNIEACFQAAVIQQATKTGWLTYHTHDARRSDKGFPDLVMARERVIFAELKASNRKPTPEQELWLGQLSDAGAEVYVWRPRHWDTIATVLTQEARRG